MTRFDVLSLGGLPAPDVIEELDYEVLLDEGKAKFSEFWEILRAENPGLVEFDTLMIESEQVTIWLEALAYRETLLRARVNDAARAVMVRFAKGADLENLAALFPVVRQPGETDERLLERLLLAPEAYSVAGPYGAYRFFAMTAAPSVKSVAVFKEGVGDDEKIVVVPLDGAGDGVPSQETLDAIRVALDPETSIPATAVVVVRAPTVDAYDVTAQLLIPHGADANVILAEAEKSLRAYADKRHKGGVKVYRNGLIAALKVSPVEDVTLSEPLADVEPAMDAAAWLDQVSLAAAVI